MARRLGRYEAIKRERRGRCDRYIPGYGTCAAPIWDDGLRCYDCRRLDDETAQQRHDHEQARERGE